MFLIEAKLYGSGCFLANPRLDSEVGSYFGGESLCLGVNKKM